MRPSSYSDAGGTSPARVNAPEIATAGMSRTTVDAGQHRVARDAGRLVVGDRPARGLLRVVGRIGAGDHVDLEAAVVGVGEHELVVAADPAQGHDPVVVLAGRAARRR